MNLSTLSKYDRELLQHKTKLANSGLWFGAISFLSTVIIFAFFVSSYFMILLHNYIFWVILLALLTGIMALFSSISAKWVNRKLPRHEELQEFEKTKSELGILLGLFSLLFLGMGIMFTVSFLGQGLSLLNI